ncbi:MAG: esterase family protein [Muribaculaceae bacterium]|nr:esterase family protein [Muribaculaceae bacterium]
MSTLRIKLVALLVAVAAMCSGAWAQPKAQSEVVEVMSEKMNRAIKCTVVLPEQYFDEELGYNRYPVVYLLHGASGGYTDWPSKARLTDLASDHSAIIVCPDGQDSWYFDSPIDPSFQFETFVSSELVKFMDTNYRTFALVGYRAITGLSMGGHGALWVGLRHPDVFGSVGSMSGGVDITKFPNRWNIDKRLGKYEQNKEVWAQHAVMSLVDKIQPGQNIIIDDGSEDFFYEVNMALHNALLERKIKHDFTIRPGGHTWDYWVNSLDYHMLFFSKAFDRAK